MGGTSQGASSVILRESLVLHLPGDKALGLGPYQWLQATKCGWVKATGAAAICPLWLQPVVSGLCHRQATPEDLCETQHTSHTLVVLMSGVTFLSKDRQWEVKNLSSAHGVTAGIYWHTWEP